MPFYVPVTSRVLPWFNNKDEERVYGLFDLQDFIVRAKFSLIIFTKGSSGLYLRLVPVLYTWQQRHQSKGDYRDVISG